MRPRLAVALAAALVGATACGGGSARGPELVVSAAASLKQPFTAYGHRFTGAHVRYSFAGSDLLAAQIRAGFRPNVFAAANTQLPAALARAGYFDPPVVFAGNRLVIAVPAAGARRVGSLADLERPGVALAIGTPSVPVGAYTRTVLARLPNAARARILANVRSREPDVSGIVGKLTQGAADAGFLYRSDVTATGGRLRAIDLPAALEPRVAYGVAVIRGTPHGAAARRFVAGLLDGAGAAALRAAGFLPPPR